MSYTDYVNSYFSNDINVLQKRRNQTKKICTAAAVAGTICTGVSLLPKNKIKIPCVIAAATLLLGALNGYNYVKKADEKIAELNVNA